MTKFFIVFLIISFQTLFAQVPLQKLSLQLSWFNQFQFAGYYMAKEKGFYKEAGLDVEIKPFSFGIDIPSMVDKGAVDFAVGRETLLLERASGKNIVALSAIFQSSPIVLLSTKESNINKIQDFKNKRVMTTFDDANEVSLKAMIAANQVSFNDLTLLPHTHNINSLIEKKTDIISAYISKTPFNLQQEGIPYTVFSPKDYGFDMYSDLLFTSNTLLENKPQQVIQFKEASLRGWQYAYDNIYETVNLILNKYNTQNLTKEELLYEAQELKKLSFLNNVQLGSIRLDKMQRISDLYNLMGLLPKKVDINEFVFNDTSFYTTLTPQEKEFIQHNPIITVGVQKGLKPITFIDNLGMQKGIIHDYFKIISEKTGLRFISEIDTKENLFTKLHSKKIDILAVVPRKNSADFLYTKEYMTLHSKAFKLSSLKNLQVNTIGTLEKLYNQKKVFSQYPQAKIIALNTIEDAINALMDKKIDLLYIPEEILATYIQDHHIHEIDYASKTIESTNIPLSFAVEKSSSVLQNILSKAFQRISYSQHQTLHNKWIPVVIDQTYNWSLIWQILGFLGVVIVMIIYKQISMNRLNNELKKVNTKLKELSERDFLTKLYNRRYFEDVIKKVLYQDKKDDTTTSLMMFDIDDFKKINDTYGHHIGDQVLVELAFHIKRFSRSSDIIARVGGEEFLILLPNTSQEDAKKHCENLRKMIEEIRIKDGSNTITFTVSMGLTSFKEDDTLNSVLLRTDNSLYQVKRSGKNSLLVS